MRNRTKHAALCVVAGVCLPTVSQAKSPVDLGVAYTADTVTTISGGADHNARFLDNVDVTADVDLDALVGWSGATVHVDVLNNMGLRPNEAVGSVEGVNNIEVPRRHLKLYEAWIEQQIGKSLSVRAGLYNLNSEFYVTEASDLLIGPAFGIGSELSGTGVNGPSIFPSTALAARVHVAFGKTGYVQAAVINADARTWGDPGGIDTRFDNGVLMIAEAGTGDRLRLSVGAWRYSQRANDAFWLDVNGNPLRRRVEGVYGLAQWTVSGNPDGSGSSLTLFARGGISNGTTGPFKSSWQLGGLWDQPISARPESQVGFGVHQGRLGSSTRMAAWGAGAPLRVSETTFELTYSDSICSHLTIQPDVQYVLRPGAVPGARDALVTTLRLGVQF